MADFIGFRGCSERIRVARGNEIYLPFPIPFHMKIADRGLFGMHKQQVTSFILRRVRGAMCNIGVFVPFGLQPLWTT